MSEVGPTFGGDEPAPVIAPEERARGAEPTTETPRVESLKVKRAPKKQPAAGQGTLKERTRQCSLYLELPVYEQLREIAFHERVHMHELFIEGIDLLLRKRGAPPIKELMKKAG
ncbi:MAG: hypothetical protein ACLPKB_20485 [Xanthobacteraceae bacterium]